MNYLLFAFVILNSKNAIWKCYNKNVSVSSLQEQRYHEDRALLKLKILQNSPELSTAIS